MDSKIAKNYQKSSEDDVIDINELINELKEFDVDDSVDGDVESYNELIENILPILERINKNQNTSKEHK